MTTRRRPGTKKAEPTKTTTKAATARKPKLPFPMPPMPEPTPDEPPPPPEAIEGLLDRMLRHKREFIPKSGFNLVGCDDFELPGEDLYLIAHFATRKEAEAAMKQRGGSDRMYVYGPDDE